MPTLVKFKFGEFGNYGSRLVVKTEEVGMPSLSLENWAYGETEASITTHVFTANDLENLGKELIQAASQLKKAEEVAT